MRRRRAASRGRRAGGARGPLRDRVRRQHPGHARRRGEDERERLRRRAGRVLEWVELAEAEGLERRVPGELGLGYRSSNLRAGEIVVRASLLLEPGDRELLAATLAEMRRRRHEAQPQGIKTFGSTFKNPEDPRAGGGSAGTCCSRGRLQRPRGRRRAVRAQARQLHREHRRRDDRRVVAVMAEGRRRVLELTGVELEPEVQTLGPFGSPGGSGRRGRRGWGWIAASPPDRRLAGAGVPGRRPRPCSCLGLDRASRDGDARLVLARWRRAGGCAIAATARRGGAAAGRRLLLLRHSSCRGRAGDGSAASRRRRPRDRNGAARSRAPHEHARRPARGQARGGGQALPRGPRVTREARFPHGMRIEVDEELPVAALRRGHAHRGRRRRRRARDGAAVGSLPTVADTSHPGRLAAPNTVVSPR